MKYRSKYYKIRFENEISVVMNNSLEIFILDGISTEILLLLCTPKDFDQIVNTIYLKYNVNKNILYNDIKLLISSFIKKDLLEVY